MNWHVESIKDTAARLRTDPHTGLDTEEAERRLKSFGGNVIAEQSHKTFWQRVGFQLRAFLPVILLSSACISLVVAVNSPELNWAEPLTVAALTVVCAVVLAAVEQSAEDTRVKLLSLSETECRALRDGRPVTVSTALLVPGDVMILGQGDIVPADGRLIRCRDLRCDERTVGGEELSALKDAASEPDVTSAISGRTNIVYAGCPVISGKGRAIVTETGSDTEAGKQSILLEYVDERNTPMKRQIADMNKSLALAGLIIMLVVFVCAFMARRIYDIRAIDIFVAAIALAVVIIPECVPLAAASIRIKCAAALSGKGASVKNADILEPLGCVSVICTGKDSLLEKRRMAVKKLWTPDGRLSSPGKHAPSDSALRLLEYAALCGEKRSGHGASGPHGENAMRRDGAIASCLRGYGIKKRDIEAMYPRAASCPQDPKKQLTVTVHTAGESYVAIIKGPPERVIGMCGGETAESAHSVCRAMGEQSLQVVGVACMGLDSIPEDGAWPEGEHGFALMGLIGLENRPAQDMRRTAEKCHSAGIRVVMLTGDQASTAKAVASDTGILRPGEEMLTSDELSQMNDKELESNLRKYSVFASMSAEDKLRVIRAWQRSGETVAATGDSAADITVLRQADVGCSMGVRDTDNVKGSADISLTDSSLSAVYSAVCEGRRAFRNIRSAVQYILVCSLALSVLFVTAAVLTGAVAMTPAQLLLFFPLAELLPAAAHASEPADGQLVGTPPRRPDSRFFSPRFILDASVSGAAAGILAVIAFYTGLNSGVEQARTMAFAAAALGLPAHALSARTTSSFLERDFYKNRDFLLTLFICVSITLLLLLLPWRGFSLCPLTFGQWTAAATLAAVPFAGGELIKRLRKALGGHIISEIDDI